MQHLPEGSIKSVLVRKVGDNSSSPVPDQLSVEEPLEIRIAYGPEPDRVRRSISVTMRTPGNDLELALGFLFTEGLVYSYEQVKKAEHTTMNCQLNKGNIVQIEFVDNFKPRLQLSDRNFYTTSSCGICGKSSIQAIRTTSQFKNETRPQLDLSKKTISSLRFHLGKAQSCFAVTGGIHASALFTISGTLIMLREDVGRHNALDKLIGNAFLNNNLPLNQHILLLSGRASFELIQKAAMAGISIVVAIGAPSSLAVELAVDLNLTLIGFLKEDSFNIYNLGDNVSIGNL